MTPAARRVYARSLAESTLCADYGVEELPADASLLLEADRYALGPDGRAVWAELGESQRVSLLERSRVESARRETIARARNERDRLCAEYIDALCSVKEVPEADRKAACDRLDRAREAWFAVRGKKLSRASHLTSLPG